MLRRSETNNLVVDAIADGLKPQADTLSVGECTMLSIDAKLGRIEALQERAVVAAERQADALETIAALFASCIGVSNAWCPDSTNDSPAVNYIRASGDGKPYRCDQTTGQHDDDDDED